MRNENGRQTMFIPVKYSSTTRDEHLYTHIKEKEKKRTLHLVQSHGIWCACGCVSMCMRTHLSACVYELFVSPPQPLGCWVCSLKRLCFLLPCHSPSLLSLSVSHIQILSTSVLSLSVSFTISVRLCSIICTLS